MSEARTKSSICSASGCKEIYGGDLVRTPSTSDMCAVLNQAIGVNGLLSMNKAISKRLRGFHTYRAVAVDSVLQA
ncbi:hypothetical protein CERSUDRAFT_86380 [Gelatoporia subvermispora B]|uniref:Uncharacterized protein n=1 Tax=Ceriporiopsis subvermispora (strain B) TaxID=914234 RepID=M2PEG2_CERS8|nr:hypothetical protein CERSUDRAFT_86380 [Gelatoporia subvermispora B]